MALFTEMMDEALDGYLGVDGNGKLKSAKHGLSLKDWQSLRDRLFKHHDHPPHELED